MKSLMKLAVALVLVLTACKKDETPAVTYVRKPTANTNVSTSKSLSKSPKGSGGIELVYYDSMLVKMNSMELSETAAASQIAHNRAINILYESEGFYTVTDAIQGDGYNPLWRVVDIVFNSGFRPHQFYTDDQVLNAASGPNPSITLVTTDEVYRCGIIQHTKTQ